MPSSSHGKKCHEIHLYFTDDSSVLMVWSYSERVLVKCSEFAPHLQCRDCEWMWYLVQHDGQEDNEFHIHF